MAKAKEKKPKEKPQSDTGVGIWDLVQALHVKVDGLKVAQQRHEGADKVSFERALQHLVTLGREINTEIAGQKRTVAARAERVALITRVKLLLDSRAVMDVEAKAACKRGDDLFQDNVMLRKQNAAMVAEVTRLTGLWAHALGRNVVPKGKTR